MTASCSKLWLLAVVCVALLYRDGPKGNGVLCNRNDYNFRYEQVGKNRDEETDVSASEPEDGDVSDADDSDGISEGACPKNNRNCLVKPSRKKEYFDDESEGEDNEDEGKGSDAITDDDDDYYAKPITKPAGARNKFSENKNGRGKTYRDEDEEEENVNYNKKQAANKKTIQDKNTMNGKYNNNEVGEDDIGGGNYKKDVKTPLKRRGIRDDDDDDDDDAFNNMRLGSNRNMKKRGRRFQSEEDKNEDNEEGNDEGSDEVDNDIEGQKESESSITIISGNSKDVVKFLNEEVKPFKLDTRRSNKELLQKIEKVTKSNKSRKNGDNTKVDINVYIHNIVKKNPRKKSSRNDQKRETLISIVKDILIPLMHNRY